MKYILFVIMTIMGHNFALAALPGKYQLQVSNGLSGIHGTFEFLLNGKNEVKLLTEYDGYYIQSFSVHEFFGALSFDVEWGSDEEQHHFHFTLENQGKQSLITKACSIYIDGPNAYHTVNETGLVIKKWNTLTKTYDELSVKQSQKTLNQCEAELAKTYL